MKIKDYLGKKITIKIDRPLGTRHLKHNFYLSFKLWLCS